MSEDLVVLKHSPAVAKLWKDQSRLFRLYCYVTGSEYAVWLVAITITLLGNLFDPHWYSNSGSEIIRTCAALSLFVAFFFYLPVASLVSAIFALPFALSPRDVRVGHRLALAAFGVIPLLAWALVFWANPQS